MTAKNDEFAAAASLAWQNGLAAMHGQDRATARLWLERAARLAPEDPRIALDLANARAAAGDDADLAAAAAAFADLARRYDDAVAWLGLMTARRLLGEHEAAAGALAAMLSRHCVPAQPDFAAAAGLVATAAGWPGWCGADAAGGLLLAAAGTPRFKLDGAAWRPARRAAPMALPEGRQLDIAIGGKALLGSPLDLVALRRIDGVVDAGPHGLTGWASRPAAPATPPDLTLTDAFGGRRRVAFAAPLPPEPDAPFLPRYPFTVDLATLRGLVRPFRLAGPHGGELFGSPIDPVALAAADRPAAQPARARLPRQAPSRASLAVVLPVYRGLAMTQACLAALLAAAPAGTLIIAVDDATPEPALAAWLEAQAAAGRIVLCRHAANRGFPAAVNTGIAAAAGHDILLLNSDTLLPPGAIETMLQAAYARADTGSVTPLSNEATILSYPRRAGGNPAPDLAGAAALNQLARQANSSRVVEIPTGIGFCMLLRHDCLAATGELRGEIFAQGYGEENDWCLRAGRLGYRHVAATGAYVAHLGGASFGAAGRALNQRNGYRLNRLYPGYDAAIGAHVAADPLAPARRRLDLLRFAAGRAAGGAVLLISHQHGGGVARRINEEMAALRAAGQRPILLFPAAPDDLATPFPWQAELTDDRTGDFPNLRFNLPAALPELLQLLRQEDVRRVVLHHALGHHPLARQLAARLGVPQDIVIHDYTSFCLRVNLLTRPAADAELRYCGEPNVAGCIACVARNGDETFEGIGVVANLARSAAEFAAAATIAAPSADAARRIARHFPGIQPSVTPWEDDGLPVRLRSPRAGRRHIVVIGGIGPAKGFDILIACAEDAATRGLALRFTVAGASAEDRKLLETGRIFVTGAYQEGEATRLIDRLDADLAFLPSIWPETWCFALTEAWRAGLYALSFDLGAQGQRLRATGRGTTLPLGLPPSRINDVLLAWQPDLRNSDVTNRTMI